MTNLPPPKNWKPSKKSKGVFRFLTYDERKLVASFIEKNNVDASCREFAISSTMARGIAKQFGVKPKPIGRIKQYTEVDVKQWIEYLKINPKIKHCAINFGCSHDTIKRLVNEYQSNNSVL